MKTLDIFKGVEDEEIHKAHTTFFTMWLGSRQASLDQLPTFVESLLNQIVVDMSEELVNRGVSLDEISKTEQELIIQFESVLDLDVIGDVVTYANKLVKNKDADVN